MTNRFNDIAGRLVETGHRGEQDPRQKDAHQMCRRVEPCTSPLPVQGVGRSHCKRILRPGGKGMHLQLNLILNEI